MLIRGFVGAIKEPKTPNRKKLRSTCETAVPRIRVQKMTMDMILSDEKPITATQAATVFKLFARATGILEDEEEIRLHCDYLKDDLKEEIESRKDEVARIKSPDTGEISITKAKIKNARKDLKSAKTEDEKYNAETALDDATDELEHWQEELEIAQASLKEITDDKRKYLVDYVNRKFFEKGEAD